MDFSYIVRTRNGGYLLKESINFFHNSLDPLPLVSSANSQNPRPFKSEMFFVDGSMRNEDKLLVALL